MAGGDNALPPYLIVDGHNVIHAWGDLREMAERSGLAAREELHRRLTTYQDVSGERVVLVYDGKGERVGDGGTRGTDSIQVFYSSAASTADRVIERLSGKYADRRRITVASNDRAVLDTCSSFGAEAISAKGLLERVERAEEELRKRIGRS